ncbi:hypothetical protein C0J52_11756 [Blattella germanica]|nr:hypothetical protein C0J52_11756 [Blattella germanica]
MQKPLLTGCNVCGRNHSTESCSFLRELKPIQDTKTPSKARLTLPTNLEVQNLADNSTAVIARALFARSVQFGPFIARHTQMLNPAVNFPLKVFGKNEESSYFLDTSDEEACNWMCLVAPASNCKEQNLICYQMGQDIYYTVMKDIQAGEQLRVWYAPYYAVKMGAVPFNVDLATTNRTKATDHIYESKPKEKEKERKNFHGMLLTRQLGARRVPDTWRCRICSAQETSVVSFAKHLMSHYKRSLGDRLIECHICQQKFATEKLLVKHKVVRHKMVIQRPRLLENMEEEESAVIDAPEGEASDMLEGNDSGMTSIVIANLTGELPSQYTQAGAQTIFVTNSGQIFADSVAGNEMQDRQNDALNVLLEQLQASDPYRDISNNSSNCNGTEDNTNLKTPQTMDSGKEMQETVFSQNDLSEKDDNSLGLTDTSITNQYESMEEEQQEQGEESESLGILGGFKPTTTVALNAEQNNGENIINIINTHVSLLEDSEDQRILTEEKSKSADINEVDDSLLTDPKTNKNSEIDDNIFEAFQTSSHISKDLLSQSSSETDGTISGHYQMKESSKLKDKIEVNDIVNGTHDVTSNVNCLISSADMENDEATSELQLSVGQDDVSSAFLELVSAPSFGTNNNTNSNKELENNGDGEDQSLQDDIQLLPNFDLDSVPEEATLLSEDNAKMVDMGPPYNCDICNKEFHKADYLYRHLRKHTGEFTCVSCLAVFARKESLINHICFSDASVIAENASFTCPYCQKKYLLKKLFKRHMAKHTGEWKCDKCQRFYSSRTTLSSHRCTKKPSPTYKCQVCKKEFLRHSYLDKHMLLHLENHPCSSCGKKLPSGEILDSHQLYCARGKLLETVGETTCPHCTIVFSQLVPYREHIYQHTHPFICQHCGARFKTDAGRTGHICSDSSYSCEVCKKSFSFFNLSRHQVMHGVPQFHCYDCGKSFFQCDILYSLILAILQDVLWSPKEEIA